MRTLAFDTSGPWCTAALLVEGACVALRDEAIATGQAERLFPLVLDMLAEGGHSLEQVNVLGVGVGPGNFTGLRIAVAAARGLALALKVPALGVPLAEARRLGLPPDVAVVEPGAAGQIIVTAPGAAPAPCRPEDLARRLGQMPLTGAAAGIVAARTGGPVLPPAVPLAEAIARLAAMRAATPQPRPAPRYLRPPDAAPAREAAPVLLD